MMPYQTSNNLPANNLPTGSCFFPTGNRDLVKDGAGLLTPSPLGPGHHHVDIAAATSGADKPLAPFGLGAISSGDLRWVGLGPVTAVQVW
jgi:hypothetical protein